MPHTFPDFLYRTIGYKSARFLAYTAIAALEKYRYHVDHVD
jgi:hypothetical protein